MSKHISRKRRWAQQGPSRYTSRLGEVVYQQKAWYGILEYQTPAPRGDEAALPTWEPHTRRLGPFKRPRNAMVALEQEARILRNRHGSQVRINGEP